MSRKRSDFENSFFGKLTRFVNGEYTPFKEESGYSVDQTETERRIHDDFFKEAEWTKKQNEADSYVSEYEGWAETKGIKLYNRLYRILAGVVCVAIIAVLLYTVSMLPSFGNPDNPANNEVPKRYIEKGIEETGAVNTVAGMILDYRAFDTLGESHVLFIATICVLVLLKINEEDEKEKKLAESDDRRLEPKNDMILRFGARFLVPVIELFGIYIILNGHLSAGGGFSGGAVMGAGLVLYLNAYGFKKTERFFTMRTFSIVSVSALLFYSISKTYSFITGANDIESFISNGTPGNIISSGLILPLNICVGMVVACTIYAFYAIFRKGNL